MFYYLSQFGDEISVLNVFRYITFRTGGATFTALLFSWPRSSRSLYSAAPAISRALSSV